MVRVMEKTLELPLTLHNLDLKPSMVPIILGRRCNDRLTTTDYESSFILVAFSSSVKLR